MLLTTLQIDPSSSADIADAQEVLALLGSRLSSGAPVAAPASPGLEEVVRSVANPRDFEENRLGYLRRVALAGAEGASISELLSGHFDGNYQRFGGTHASIERNWRASGGLAFAEHLIRETPDRQRQVMLAEARPHVLALVGHEPPTKDDEG